MLREYGWSKRYVSEAEGYNSRLDELQAALLNVRIEHLKPILSVVERLRAATMVHS